MRIPWPGLPLSTEVSVGPRVWHYDARERATRPELCPTFHAPDLAEVVQPPMVYLDGHPLICSCGRALPCRHCAPEES